MRFDKRYNRRKGTVEAFTEDASVAGDNAGLNPSGMVATVTDGSRAITIDSQSFSSSTEELTFLVNFTEVGNAYLKVVTSFTGSDQKVVSLYAFTTLDDGTGRIGSDYGL